VRTAAAFDKLLRGFSPKYLRAEIIDAVAHFAGQGFCFSDPGVPLRSTPGFMPPPAPQAKNISVV